MSGGQDILSVRDLGRSFTRGGKRLLAVDGVDLDLAPGETLGIVGESGCGKSTLARLILRLVEPDRGSIRFAGEEITEAAPARLRQLRARMQIVFQDPNASLNSRWSVGAIIAEPLAAQGWSRADQRDRVREVLELVGLPADAALRHPSAFSGGQRQRIGIARALAPAPDLVVCDEAVSALDASVQAQILNLLADLQDRLGLAMLFISHNLAVVRHVSRRVAVMYLGQVVELAPEEALFGRPAHPYTAALIAAVPEAGRTPRNLARDAEPANALAPPSGCHFHPRCPVARPRCAELRPELVPYRPGHLVRCHYPGELIP